MGASGHRFTAIPFVLALAIGVASACGGAASTSLDRPSLTQQGDDTSPPAPEASGSSSSSGGRADATVSDDASPDGDMTADAADEPPVDDVESPDAGPDAGMCGVCPFASQCCTVPGARSYGKCYNVLCLTCCL